jgi:tetratricopeptide (TPR) repeat protein
MRHWLMSCLLCVSLAAAAPAHASFGGGSSSPPPPTPGIEPPPSSGEGQTSLRQDAAREYGDAYENVGKAKKDLANGKEKNAEKKFKKALDRGQKAVDIDSTYHEAWNLVGYCARQLKDYDRSLAAYQTCLRIKPDYAPAREYLGEAYLELGKPDLAREQLAFLEKADAEDEVGRLQAAIDTYDKAHPEQASAPQAMTPTPKSGTIEAAATSAPDSMSVTPAPPPTK